MDVIDGRKLNLFCYGLASMRIIIMWNSWEFRSRYW